MNLYFNTLHSDLKEGDVIHLRIVSNYEQSPGKWRLTVDDITPIHGAEPTGYGCHLCCLIEEAKEDGSLPDGWIKKEFKERSFFICSDCQKEGPPYCRVCG